MVYIIVYDNYLCNTYLTERKKRQGVISVTASYCSFQVCHYDNRPRATKVLANKVIVTLLTQMTTMMVVKLSGFSLVYSLQNRTKHRKTWSFSGLLLLLLVVIDIDNYRVFPCDLLRVTLVPSGTGDDDDDDDSAETVGFLAQKTKTKNKSKAKKAYIRKQLYTCMMLSYQK